MLLLLLLLLLLLWEERERGDREKWGAGRGKDLLSFVVLWVMVDWLKQNKETEIFDFVFFCFFFVKQNKETAKKN